MQFCSILYRYKPERKTEQSQFVDEIGGGNFSDQVGKGGRHSLGQRRGRVLVRLLVHGRRVLVLQ